MHSTWSCVFQTPHKPHSRVGALLSEKWPYTRNWAKSRGGRSFVSGHFFTRLRYIRHKWRVALSAFENFADIIEVLKPSSSTTVALCCNLIHYCRCFASLCYFFPLLPLFCKVLMALQTLLHKTSDFHSTFSALCCASSLFSQGERAYDTVWGRHQKIWSYQGQIQRTFRETPKCNFQASKIQQSKTGTGQTCRSFHHHTVHTHRTLQLRNIT